METNSAQQEILLLTGTSFSSRQFSEINGSPNNTHLSEKERLAIACWNGLLPEILPEVFEQKPENKRLYVWEIREASSFLELELGETYLKLEKHFSIDPYSFLPVKRLS